MCIRDSLRWSKKAFTNNVSTAIEMYYSFFITLSILQPKKSYSKRRCHCSIVLLFALVLFWYFFTHISERSILNTLNDVRSNLLLDETMTLFSFQVLSWWKSYNKNDRDQVLWAHETKHPTQTLVFTETAGRQPGWGRCYLRSSVPRGPWERAWRFV